MFLKRIFRCFVGGMWYHTAVISAIEGRGRRVKSLPELHSEILTQKKSC